MSDWLRFSLLLASSFLLTILLIPGVRGLAIRWSCVSMPSAERWHRRPTPYLGGVAFFISFLFSVLWFSSALGTLWPLLLVVSLTFLLGLYDDLSRINPATKLMGQIIAAAIALVFGYSLHFFTWPIFDALLTALW